MPQGPNHIFFIANKANEFYYVENGTVFTTTTPRPLPHTPDKWLDMLIENIRNPKYFALDRAFSDPLEFVLEGAHILEYLYYSRGPEEQVDVIIAEQRIFVDATHYGYYYTQIYRGEVDLGQFQHDGPKVTGNLLEGGPVKYIRANEGVTQEIPFDNEAISVELTGIRLHQSANYLISNGALPNNLGGSTLQMDLLAIEAITSIGATTQQRIKTSNSASALWNLGQKFLTTGATSTEVTFEWDFYMTPELAAGITPIFGTRIILQCNILASDSSLNVVELQIIGGGDPLLLYNRKHHFKGSLTISIPGNRVCVAYMSAAGGANGNRDFTYFTYDNNGSFNIKYTYTHPSSYIQAYRPQTLLNKLAGLITEQQYTILSNALVEYKDVVVTCGDAIRGIADARIKTTFLQFFQAFNCIAGLGLGMVGSQLRMEKKGFFIDYTDPIDLGEVRDMVITPAQDHLYKIIRFGYANQDYDDVNGRQEFNTTTEWSTPNVRSNKVYEAISPYRADCYGIEFTRINLEGKTTTDNSADNDVFLIHISESAVPDIPFTAFRLDRSLNPGATGLLEPNSVFNLFLSPARCLRRNGDFLHSFFYQQESKILKFQTIDKNREVSAGGVDEDADIPISSLATPLFTPNVMKFLTKGHPDLSVVLADDPLKSFTWLYGGVRWYGIPVEVSERVADKQAQEFTMLSAPHNDLTKLINNNG